uniref:serine/arginine repetitive matrix protein 1-like n=1 Tax=Erigeron canadensis TaxID=72917 RepID=UPI001CB88C9C|nr:serine/arginine repetitive matrix protein 1-like [Erigeron canadensis]XP_043615460.1 serine/arginine repetitive matrix protein 1-like [Erigeron canadensis]
MERRIDPDSLLDYVELQIFPTDNRYEAFVSASNRIEKVASGDLHQLLSHLPQVKDLSSKTSDSNFRILPPDDVKDAQWFTTTTLKRFLAIVGSQDILSIGNEISQLVETRKFQLSLFAKAEVDMTSSFESKNELLRAVDSRLSGLKEQIVDALFQATGARFSLKDISDLENFAHHFGAEDIRDSLQKLVEVSPLPSPKDSTIETVAFASQPSQLNPPVKYGVSPAKAAQIERQSSTDSENSFSSEEEQPSVERSRTVARSATPRRSASPMRRVQIGRTGPRRSATLSIKSLNYFPGREKTATQRDAAVHDSEDEDLEKPAKQNALRMSVQDKISLFENKQKDQVVDTEKPKTLPTAPVANKAVLRRWSSGMSESATQCVRDTSNETVSPKGPEDPAPGGNAESCTQTSISQSSETAENIKSSSFKRGNADVLDVEMETRQLEMHPASIEWNQQKEAELNQLFKKMMESKPVRRHSVNNDNSKSKSNPKEQRGGFYDHYKQKRDEKLRKEASGKKSEKESQFKEMEKFLDERKAEIASTNDVSKKKVAASKARPQVSQKNTTQLPSSSKETSKASVVKKTTAATTTKPSPLPATRKSWPATPSPRPTGGSPAKTPSSGSTPTANLSRKPQSTSSVVRSSTKVEKPQPRPKTLKSTPPEVKKNIKTVKEKKQPTVTKGTQTAKPKSRTQADIHAATATTAPAKPSFYNKVTKKSSVVPLETKPFLRKGTGIGPGVGAVVVKSKLAVQPEEPLNTGDLIQAEKNLVVDTTEITSPSPNQDMECGPAESLAKLNLETQVASPTKCEEPESPSHNQSDVCVDDMFKMIETVDNNIGTEEESTLSISPTAWVEIEEHHRDEIIPCKESPMQVAGQANLAASSGVSSPRVRHSLFQMLLEETTSEADSCEWGNAQHPPTIINQKDAPKGFKRLLKFARKTKADLSLTDGSSPSSIFRRG